MGKKIFIVALIAAIAFSGYAQKKPKASKAFNYFKKNELALAKDEIDRAVLDEKQGSDGKTWYYRGLIYCALDTTTNADFKSLADNPLTTAVEAFDKAEEMNTGKEYYIPNESGLPILKSQQIDMLWSNYLNNGAGYYNEQEFESALKEFEKSIMLKPQDTTAYLYAGTVAAMSDNQGAALKYFSKCKELGIGDKDVYGSLINLERSYNKDTAAALAIVREAIEKFAPDNDSFKKEEINILIVTNQVEPAKQKIQENIDSDPTNETLYYSLGFLLDQTGDAEGAVEAYKKALEIKPDYFEANYNTGVFYYNGAIAKQNEVNNLGISKADQAKRKELQPQVGEYFEKAKPYFEAALETNPDDMSVIETLELIYMQTGDKAKADEMTKKIEAMGGN